MTMGNALGIVLDATWLGAAILLVRTSMRARRTHGRLFLAAGLGATTSAAELVIAVTQGGQLVVSLLTLGLVFATAAAIMVALFAEMPDEAGGLIALTMVLLVAGPILAHALSGGFHAHNQPGEALAHISHASRA